MTADDARHSRQAPENDAEARLAGFLAKYDPEIAELARGIRTRIQRRVGGGRELVYDNYNGLVIGYGPSEKSTEAVLSIALYPTRVRLFFLQGATLPDPHGILEGKGKRVRSVVVETPELVDEEPVRDLIREAVARASVPMATAAPLKLVIKSVSAKQRPRRRG